MIHEQFPSEVPRCDVVHELACAINELQDAATIVLGQGFALLANEQATGTAPAGSLERSQTDPDPELTAFLGTLGLCSFIHEAHSFTAARFACMDKYDELQGHISWCEDTIAYHALQHHMEGCTPVTLAPSVIAALDTVHAETVLPQLKLQPSSTVVPRPRTPH